MPIKPQPLALQFAGGIETKQDSKQVPTTKLLELENATFIKQTTLAKRNGYEALSTLVDTTESSYSDAIGLASRDNELLLFTPERAYSYRSSADRWADTGEVGSVEAYDDTIARTGTAQTMPDHATNTGIRVVAWEDSRGGVYCSVVEAATGRILLAETELDDVGQAPRCVPCGTVLHVYWTRPAAGRIYVAVINPASPGNSPAPAILTDDLLVANPVYDAMDGLPQFVDIAPAVIAWAIVGGYRVGYVHPSGVLGSPATGLPSVATWADAVTGPIAVQMDQRYGDSLFVAWCDASPHIRNHDPLDLLDELAVAQVSATSGTWNRIALDMDDDEIVWWIAELDGARDDLNRIESGARTLSLAESVAARTLRGHGLLSRAFYDQGHIYAIVGHAVQSYPYAACIRLSSEELGGAAITMAYYRSVVGQLPGLPTRKHVASVHPVGSGAFSQAQISVEAPGVEVADGDSPTLHTVCVGYRIQLDSENGDQYGEAGIRLVSLDFAADTAYQSAQIGRGLYLAGAAMQHYDGRRWAEAGFHCAPDVESGAAVVAEGAAGAMAAGVYLYKLVYEEIDALGELHQSAPSISFSVTIAASKKVNVTIPTYRLTSKRRVRIGVFRSPVNSTGTALSIPFYRVTSLDPDATGDNGHVANDPTVDTISFVDNMPDAGLITKEPLYTNGGILGNDPSPMRGDVIAGGKSRLFWTDPGQPNWIRYSQEIVEDYGMEAPIRLAQQTDPYGGRVVGIGVMDGAVYTFCETAIYGFGGPGPLRNPSASDASFSPPELITSDVGCKSPNSICQGPVGIFFQSEKGIRLLDRSRQVVDIGAPVYRYNSQTITRATLLPDRSQVVFLTDDGTTLLYDYERGMWSTFTNHLGVDARVVGGVYYYLRTDGRVFRETPGEYLDDNAQIRMRIETAWIHFLPYFQGWQRVLWAYFLGTHRSDHDLVVRYRIDDNAGYSAPITLDVTANYDPDLYGEGAYGAGEYGGEGGDTTRYQRAIHFNVPCQAIQFRLEDHEDTGAAGASFELSELLLIGGVLDLRAKIGPARVN